MWSFFRGVVFGHRSSSHYLIATSYRHLHVWDLLTCSGLWQSCDSHMMITWIHCAVVWSVPVSPDVLIADPHSSTAAVFIPSPASNGSADRKPPFFTPFCHFFITHFTHYMITWNKYLLQLQCICLILLHLILWLWSRMSVHLLSLERCFYLTPVPKVPKRTRE